MWRVILIVGFVFMDVRLDAQPMQYLAIQAEDVEALGGWPLDRKWYALAVQNLMDAGAEAVYLDIAFPTADVAHPESDLFFYQTVQSYPHLYMPFTWF